MDQKNFLTQALDFIQTQRRHRWWMRAVTGMAAVVVFVTTYLLILPAITMENSTFEVTVTPSEAPLGEAIHSKIYTEADDGREETYFVISADGDNAGLDESQLDFDSDGVAAIEDENGQTIELHREYTENGEAQYWFVLLKGQSANFSLPWVNGTDRYRSELIEEEIPVQPEEQPVEDTIPEEPELPESTPPAEEVSPTDTGETLPPETDVAPEEPSGDPDPSEQSSEPETSVPEQDGPEVSAPVQEEPAEETEMPSADVPQEPEAPAVEDSVPALPVETAPAKDNEPAEDMIDQTKTHDLDTLATNSNATFAAASISNLRYDGVVPMRAAGASTISLSRHKAPLVARAYTISTASDAASVKIEEARTHSAEADENEIEYETVYHTETVLERSGNPALEGSLALSYGLGSSLEDALYHMDHTLVLTWAMEEIMPQIPEDATSWATVEKEGFTATASNSAVMRQSAIEMAEPETREGHDFSNNITSVTVSQQINGQWVAGTEFNDGANVRVTIAYTIPQGAVGTGNKTIYYQMPENIELSKTENGTVYDNNVPVGTYTITQGGLITIVFNDHYADDRPFSGQIQFQGTLRADEGEDGTEVDFGAGGTITVKPNPAPTDVRVDKTGFHQDSDGKLHYTLTVSSSKGTDGTITVTDAFESSNTNATYDENSFQIVKIDANGSKTQISGYTPTITEQWSGGPQKFDLSGLPELKAGESYEITYTATPGQTIDQTGSSTVKNNVSVTTTGGNRGNDGNSIEISKQMISKSGNYDANAQTITWTININQDQRDIGGWTLNDTITANGVTAAMPETVTISPAVNGQTSIKLPYTFPQGSNATYTITYQTKVEELEPDENATVTNDAHLTHEGEDYHAGSSVYPSNPSQSLGSWKNVGWHDTNQDTGDTGTYQWNAGITVPGDVDQGDLESLVFTDTIHDLIDEAGNEIEGSHYITAQQLGAMSVKADGVVLSLGTDYTICNASGSPISDFTGEAAYNGFQIKFTQTALTKIAGKTINLQYYTTVDYTKLTAGQSYVIKNTGGIPDHETTPETNYDKPGQLEKQASITGNHAEFTGDGITIDFEASQGVIHYRLLVHTTKATTGDIVVTDHLPAGAALIENSAYMMFYYSDTSETDSISWWDPNVGDYGSNVSYNASDNFSVASREENGHTVLAFTIKDGYNGNHQNEGDTQTNTLAIYYDVSIAKDPIWTDNPGLEEHLYTNHASWGDSEAETNVTVDREVPDLEKTGAQLPQYDSDGKPMQDAEGNTIWSNTVQYSVIINAGGKDLAPGLDYVTMWDRLTVGNAAGAELQPGKVHLYHYDPDQENNLGPEIDSSLYAYTYDEQTYTLTFNLPDETACVLVYEYVIDRGNAAGNLNISNEAHLAGSTGSGSKEDIVLADTSSSATATKRELTLYKVDATNYGKLLPGAVFKLEEYQKATGWKKLLDDLTTDENGEFTLSRVEDEHFENFNFQDNTLYRLTEIQAPAGYASLNETYYFVWVKDGQTVEQVRQEMLNNDTLGDGTVASEQVRFLTASGAVYVPNEPSDLTVKKLWQDTNGFSTDPGAENVSITLFQQVVDTNAKTVTVKSTGHKSWSTTHTSVVNLAEGSNLTILIGGVYKDSLDIQVGNSDPVSVSTGDGQIWTYTVSHITDDTVISISPTDQYEGNSFGNISFTGYTTPTFVPQGDPTEYKTVTLNKDNGWSYTWHNLPKTNNAGQRVYYHVQETTPVDGFEVIYSSNNNDGVGAGELVVINRAIFTLPETGGAGTTLFTTCDLALLALAGLMYIILRRKGDEAP